MSNLVIYFSQTGNTATLAHQIAARLDADEEAIVECNQRTGIWGAVTGALGALTGQSSSVAAPEKDPAAYDLVLIGTPVWAGAAAPAVNAWIAAHRDKCKQVAFFATAGGVGGQRTFPLMEKRMGRAPIACLAVTEKQLGSAQVDDQLDRYISEINSEKR